MPACFSQILFSNHTCTSERLSKMAFVSGSRTCCVITGASRGFGRSVAVALAGQFSDLGSKSHFVLVSRSKEGLQETRNKIVEVCSSAEVYVIVANLGEVNTLEETVDNALSKVEPSSLTDAILVNNAASLGDVSKPIKDMSYSAEALEDYFSLNISSPMFIISKFLQRFKGVGCTVVNISSLMAVQSFSYFSLYCTGKAARDMMCQVLAKEEPDVRVLNYAPGPLRTEMYEAICNTCGDQEIAATFKSNRDENKILSPDQSAGKLVNILKENSFVSGSHIDYFD